MKKLTEPQQVMLCILDEEGRWMDDPELARRMETTPAGAHLTAASLIRRKLVYKQVRIRSTVLPVRSQVSTRQR